MKFDRLKRHQLTRAELNLAYYDEALGKVPVVLQHGLCGSAQQTAEAFPDDANLRLLTLECRGHGASPAGSPGDTSIACFAQDVAAMIESCDLAPVILGGISMGAAIALRLAVHRPDLVRALILVRPAWVTESGPANMRPNAEVGDLLATTRPDRARAIFEESATGRQLASEAPDNLVSLLGFFAREPQGETAELLKRISADGPGVSEADLRALRIPALVVGHEADAIHPMAYAHRLCGLLAHSTLVEITPKAVSREAYAREMHVALSSFIKKVTT